MLQLRQQLALDQEFRDIFCQPADAGGFVSPGFVQSQRMTVGFEGRTATRGVDDDGVQAAGAIGLPQPGVDVGFDQRQGMRFQPHMFRWGAAAAGATGNDHLHSVPLQQADRGFVDPGIEDGLHAAIQNADAGPSFAMRRKDLGAVDVDSARQGLSGRHVQHGTKRPGEHPPEGPAQLSGEQPKPKQCRVRESAPSECAG